MINRRTHMVLSNSRSDSSSMSIVYVMLIERIGTNKCTTSIDFAGYLLIANIVLPKLSYSQKVDSKQFSALQNMPIKPPINRKHAADKCFDGRAAARERQYGQSS